jgi:flagellar hook-length control protein FliK
MQAPQLQEKELIGQTDSLYQKPVNTEESAGEPLDQETVASARQTENRQQPVVASNVESRVTEQQTLVQSVGESRPPEQQPVVPTNVERRATEQQQIVQPSDIRITEQQPVIQHIGVSHGKEHQQTAAQVQVVPNQGNQDASVSSKPQAMAQAFRFAQSNEVVVAAADPGRSGRDFSGQQQSPAFEQSLVPIDSMSEEALMENTGFMKLGNTPDENHHLVLQTGSRVQTTAVPLTNVDEQSRQVQSEQGARQVLERLNAHEFKQGKDQISLRLSPEHLGNVQLNLRMEEQGLKLEIIAEQRGVREALMRQGDELKESLARQNIRIDSFEVSTGNLGGQNQQQQREWRQMNPEQRMYHAQYASAARGGGTVQDQAPGVFYFAPQYQSTIDVRF